MKGNERRAKLQTLKAMVEEVLREIPATRDSDIKLTIEVWRRFYPEKVHWDKDGKHYVLLQDLYALPREDNVKRIRAHFQNDPDNPQYPPTTLEVALERGMEEQHWRRALGLANSFRQLDLR